MHANYMPLMVNLSNRNILLIGGGSTAHRKAMSLSKRCDCNYTFIAPEIVPEIQQCFADSNMINENFSVDTHKKYIDESDLIIICTDKTSANTIFNSIKQYNNKILILNSCDANNSDFIIPKYIERGNICVSVSSDGKSPIAAKIATTELEKHIDSIDLEILELLIDIRQTVKSKNISTINLKNLIVLSKDELINLKKSLM